jgi:hypothetical protein
MFYFKKNPESYFLPNIDPPQSPPKQRKKENLVFFNSGRRCLVIASLSGRVRSMPAVAALVQSCVMARLTADRRTQTSCASRGEAGRAGSAGASTQLLPARRCPSIGGGIRPAAPCTTRITDRRDLYHFCGFHRRNSSPE